MSTCNSGFMSSTDCSDYKEIKQVLITLSMKEIPYCLDSVQIDVNNPPSAFSPLHYLAGETCRTRITLELMTLYGSSPLLSFKGESLLRLAIKADRGRLAEELIKRVGLNNGADVEKDISNTPNREFREKLQTAWQRRHRNGTRMFALKLFSQYRVMRLSKNLAHEVALYI